MQVLHRVSISSTSQIQRELATMGLVVGDSGLVTFEVHESDKAWPELEGWIAKRKAVDVVTTTFSKKELAEARWLELTPDWHCGYPQPDELNFGYREATYDLTDYCQRCGIGMKQKAPFQMKNEPKWGRRSILQLNWVFDEYFVTGEVWARVFKPHGIDCRPVLNTKGAELKTVVQLVSYQEVGIATAGLSSEEGPCSECGRMKYLPLTRGAFAALTSEPSAMMVKTEEYFGSGSSAHKKVLISQAIARTLMADKIRGVSLRPVAPNEGSG